MRERSRGVSETPCCHDDSLLLRSVDGKRSINGFEITASARACSQALSFLTCPMKKNAGGHEVLRHQIFALHGVSLRLAVGSLKPLRNFAVCATTLRA